MPGSKADLRKLVCTTMMKTVRSNPCKMKLPHPCFSAKTSTTFQRWNDFFKHQQFTNILFVTSNHQTSNLDFPNFFLEFFSVIAVETENKLFIGPKQVLFQFWINEKFVFFFYCSNWEKFVEKIGENKIGCLVVWCYEQDVRFLFWIASLITLEVPPSYGGSSRSPLLIIASTRVLSIRILPLPLTN